MSSLKIIDASANNLKNFSLELPLKKFVSVTGPSGSGKTTLLRDIIFGEWKRRIDSDSNIASQLIRGLPPVFYFGNQRPPRSRESILDGLGAAPYLFELGLRIGVQRCVVCQEAVDYESLDNLYFRLTNLIGRTVIIGVPLTEAELTSHTANGDLRVILENKVVRVENLEESQSAAKFPRALDSIKIAESSKSRLLELLKHANQISSSKLYVLIDEQFETVHLVPTCSVCGHEQRPVSRELLELEKVPVPEFTNLALGRGSIGSLLSLPLDEFLNELALIGGLKGLEREILKSLKSLVSCAQELGLGYLSLDRKLRTLSSGEFQRVKLASILVEQIYGSLIALDEPSSGLSPTDTRKLGKLLANVTNQGNSVLVATHSRELIKAADEILNLQPCVAEASQSDFIKTIPKEFLQLTGINLNNLIDLDCQIPLGALTCLFGVSGSGKSTLALQVLLPLVSRLIKDRTKEVKLPFGELKVAEHSVGRVVFFRASRFFSLRRAGVVSALGAVPAIRDLFSKTELARIRGLAAKDFNFYNPSPQTGEIRFKGISFSELGKLSIEEALKLFDRIPALKNKFNCAVDLGVGYLKLAHPLKKLSAGEEQRLNLAARVSVLGATTTLFILDEPLNGLSEQEQISVLKFLRNLLPQGHTIVAVDHSPLMLEFSDWQIELGPGAGKNGGKIIGTLS